MTGERALLTSSKLPSVKMRLVTGILSTDFVCFHLHNANHTAQMEKFLYNILDDLESRFSQQMLIEFFLSAKHWDNTGMDHNEAGRQKREL